MIDHFATIPHARWASLSDLDLLAHACGAEQQPDAFRELYRRYHRPLFTFLLRRLPDRAVAEEALQETFVKLWRQADRYDPSRGSVAALLFAVGRTVAVDVQRRELRHVRDGAEVADGTPATSTTESSSELAAVVAGCVGRLPGPQRELLDLAYWGDLTQRQIAEVLRIPLGTVKSRLFHAVRALRCELQHVGVMQ